MTDLSIDRPISQTPQRPGEINARVAGLAIAALLGGAWVLGQNFAWRQGALFLLGGALGIMLYHALFGFTSAFRVFIADRRGAGLRAQMVMLACATRRSRSRAWASMPDDRSKPHASSAKRATRSSKRPVPQPASSTWAPRP